MVNQSTKDNLQVEALKQSAESCFNCFFGNFCQEYILNKNMNTMQSKWNHQIDTALCSLYEDKGIMDWTQISNHLNSVFGLPARLPKQCRQRYINCLKFREASSEWSQEQVRVLRNKYLQIGPKWVKISKYIPGRGQNTIKNKFNAALRKTLRHLNQICKKQLQKHRKAIDSEWFGKLIRVVFENYPESPQKKQFAQKLMSQLLHLIFPEIVSELSSSGEKQSRELLQNICTYNKNYLFSKKREGAKFGPQVKQQVKIKLEQQIICYRLPEYENNFVQDKILEENPQSKLNESDYFSLRLLENYHSEQIKVSNQHLKNYITQKEEISDQFSFDSQDLGEPFDFFRK